MIANDSTLLQQYLAGKGNAAIPAVVADKSKGKSFAFYVDINKILQAMPEDLHQPGLRVDGRKQHSKMQQLQPRISMENL